MVDEAEPSAGKTPDQAARRSERKKPLILCAFGIALDIYQCNNPKAPALFASFTRRRPSGGG
ncbi:MAG TPA: hypothetical protein QGF63_06520 [Alphaproteobacteria bacterium]|jgi:hypothetical protein|nr:hypothetical protein [Alphaproteobacteria bacterium]MDP7427969.1 hypothetical protein [Alphaproteobacteria bacterium]HJM49489.1 hypothetical protein [Alphaproteobacteria bacterium]|tara:strand:+ start:109 stop:294 length:186 start_codon:yes stop_codon:yes gene_type:complete